MAKKGLLLINLGSPESPTPKAVGRYLAEFLSDPYVIDLPTPFRQLLVHGWIVPRRAKSSAAAYKKIWGESGSPLIVHTRAFAQAVQNQLRGQYEVRLAMRYGHSSIKRALQDWAVDEITVVPLYPQYAESSTRTAIEAVRESLPVGRDLRILEDFFLEEEYLTSEAALIEEHLNDFQPDHLLLSFHGLPEHHMRKLHPAHCLRDRDCCELIDRHNRHCYRAQCVATAKGIAGRIRLSPERISYAFQSRLGRRPWIQPYTDHLVSALAAGGVKRLSVACPSFVADCLETLEEVQIRLREQFLSEGGEDLRLIPALNDSPLWVKSFCTLIEKFAARQ